MSLGRAIATVGSLTLLSRIIGFVRDVVLSAVLGSGPVADAFIVAFKLPNLFRRLFAEGAFSAAFVPLFAGKLEQEGPDAARDFAERCQAVLVFALLGFVALMEIFMPLGMYVLAPGFGDMPGKLELATELSRITFPYLLFISMVSLQSGVLNALGRFAAAAGTPVLLNIVSIAVLIALVPYTPTAGHAMAWGVFASGLAQFAWLVFSMKKAGMSLRFVRPRLSPDVALMLKRVVPGAVGAGVYQINLTVNTMIASKVANGAVSYLNYAERVNQLPLGVVGVAIGTALLPLLSRQLRAGEAGAALESQNRAMEMGLLLTLPAAAALMTIAHPIIAVLFERGSFTAADTDAVALALMVLASGLPAYVLVKVLTPGFFAREDTRTPVRVAGASMVLNVVVNLALMAPLGYLGMALSTSLAAWFNVAALIWLLHRRGYFTIDARLRSRLGRIVAACTAMSGCLWASMALTAPLMPLPGWRIVALALLTVVGMGTYAAAVFLTGAAKLPEVKAMLRRRK